MANGYYVDFKNFSINTEGKGRPMPVALIFLIVPILGALFLMFLPVVGFYLLAETALVHLSRKLSFNFGPRLAFGSAHILGREIANEKKEESPIDESLKNLEKEVENLRKK